MKIEDVRRLAFAMPLTSPAFPPGPYRFIDREYLIVTYRTDPAALEAVVPEPPTFDDPLVKYEFIRMPDSTGFGNYTNPAKSSPLSSTDKRAATAMQCSSMMDHPFMAVVSSGAFPRSMYSPA